MKVVIVTLNVIPDGRAGLPQVHADGCADVARGLASGKYGCAEPIDVEAPEDAALWIYRGHIGSGEIDEANAQYNTRYMPCLRSRRGAEQ